MVRNYIHTLKKRFFPSPEDGLQFREIVVNDATANAHMKFCTNEVTTAKYTVYNFVFKNIGQQLMRIANVYFLLISVLQLLPYNLSPTGQYTTIAPLAVIMFITACKDAYEDYKRHRADDEVNNRQTLVLRNGRFESLLWHQVQVGDFVRVEDKDFFPADLIVLSTSEPQGMCYIETSSLDGETNLKIRKARDETTRLSSEDELMPLSGGSLKCEKPNNRLYNFEGSMTFAGREFPLGPDQVLLRGAQLRNTKWIMGVAVFTGHDTKLMKNANETPHKRSNVERNVNKQIFLIFTFLIALCVACTIVYGVWNNTYRESTWYLRLDLVPSANSALGFFTFLILYNNFIPISLYVSMEMVKLAQATMINTDAEMYHAETDTPALARTSSLNEELGQVHFIFSDKTGTLTCNRMDFLKCSIAAEVYGIGTTEIGRAVARREGRVLRDERPPEIVNSDFQFYDLRVMNNDWMKQPGDRASQIREFFSILAVCHTVVPEIDKKTSKLIYQAASPDEGALVAAAAKLGFTFKTRSTNSVTIEIEGTKESETYTLLNVLEFTSSRKRMSVIVRDPAGRLMLYCKGADSVIYPLLGPNQRFADPTASQLETFASEGLRTLCIAKAELDEEEYNQWSQVYHNASVSLVNREQMLEDAAAIIEKKLELIGATAIEDKLQDGVPDAIAELAKAGIKLWVLTGDKQETAINIGFACSLLDNHMDIIKIRDYDKESLTRSLEAHLIAVEKQTNTEFGLVIDGAALAIALDPEVKKLFLALSTQCKSVICCRVSPLQKALVVTLVKDHLPVITLAIGDGANDVSMIQAAHVGVGISGNEGLQAARSADYAVAQFRYLKRLLLVHGRWSYRRTCRLILYSFYKNLVLYITQFFFVWYNGISGQSLYDSWTLPLWNIIFTSMPVIIYAVLDRDIDADEAERHTELYAQGQENQFFNTKTFWMNAISAMFHGAICFFLPLYALSPSNLPSGRDADMMFVGIVSFTCVLFVVTLQISVQISSWTWVTHLANWGSVAIYFCWLFLYGNMGPGLSKMGISAASAVRMYEVIYEVCNAPSFWLTLALVISAALVVDFSWKFYTRMDARQHFASDLQFQKEKIAETTSTSLGSPFVLTESEDKFLMKFPHEEVPKKGTSVRRHRYILSDKDRPRPQDPLRTQPSLTPQSL